MNQSLDISKIPGVGPKTKALLNRLEIYTVGDLAYYFPNAYERFMPPLSLENALENGRSAYTAFIERVTQRTSKHTNSVITASVYSQKTKARLIFYGMPYIKSQLLLGEEILFYGTPKVQGGICFEQPVIYTRESYNVMMSSLRPRYPLTKDLSNKKLTKIVNAVLDSLEIEDYIDFCQLERLGLMPLGQALLKIHFPKDFTEQINARKRLVFDEFYAFFSSKKHIVKNRRKNSRPITDFCLADTLLEKLSFKLTNAQTKAFLDIKADLAGEFYSNRLIQGDVGSGKTIIAILALFCNAQSGYQGAFMAPTDILARQHYQSIMKLKEMLGAAADCLKPVLLTGRLSAKEKRVAYLNIATGAANMAIGTHALFQEGISFCNLSLVITDEQHRFGVKQREKLLKKGALSSIDASSKPEAISENLSDIHYISMSATPIPRTLSMLLYSGLDISLIDEMPGGRRSIKNCAVSTSYRNTAYNFIEKEILSGRQAYVICPMVENADNASENDSGEVISDTFISAEKLENVVDYAQKLDEYFCKKYPIGILNGKMNNADKYAAMEAFSLGHTRILVSTTVVEVGVDVPNASVILIENAERFGLAQLHQLRGRVGRGEAQSYCILISGSDSQEAKGRLEIVAGSNDGFFIANEDLKLRGPGEPFGVRQSGELGFKLADIYEDAELLRLAKEMTEEL